MKRHAELAGFDVILVHRMLKNVVPVVEYVLMTDAVEACLDDSMRELCTPLTHLFDCIDLAALRVPPAQPDYCFLRRLGATVELELSTLPFVLA